MTNTLLKILGILLITAVAVKADVVKTAAELIGQAHKYDNMYTLGPEASQQKALSLYQTALDAEPNEKQRLHILYRMAQLNGSGYQLEKGEKPDFHKAVALYQQVIDTYPPEEPLVYKAMSGICDHYTTLNEFEKAIKSAKKILEYDTTQISEKLKVIEKRSVNLQQHEKSMTDEEQLEAIKQIKQAQSLKNVLAQIKSYQETAVKQIAYSAEHISFLHAHGELKQIIDKYQGTFIADRAHKCLVENMDKTPNFWSPQNDDPLPLDGTSLASGSSPPVYIESQKDMQVQSNVPVKDTANLDPANPETSDIQGNDKYVETQPRSPPSGYISKCIFGAAGLIVLGLAVTIIRKKH